MPFSLPKLRHTYTSPPMGSVLYLMEGLAVYLRLMIVSITLTSVLYVLVVLDVLLAVLDVVGGGVGAAMPVIGTSPAKIGVDSAHINTTAIASLFMVV